MKKTLVILLAIAVASFAYTRKKLDGNGVISINVLTDVESPTVISASEAFQPAFYLDISSIPQTQATAVVGDTIGYAFLRCADSVGTDSIGGVLSWWGNPRPGAVNADWEVIDSVTITAGTGTTYLTTGKLVSNLKQYMGLQFRLRNQWATAAAKSNCWGYFNRRIRPLQTK